MKKLLYAFILFAVVMFIGMYIGQMLAAAVPAMGDPMIAAIVSFIVTIAPAFLIYRYVNKKYKGLE